MGELIIVELGFLIGTIIFFSGLWLHDYIKRRKHQKWLDTLPPTRFIDSSLFHTMLLNCKTLEQQRELLEKYKDR